MSAKASHDRLERAADLQCLDCPRPVDMPSAQFCARCMTQPHRIKETLQRILDGAGKAERGLTADGASAFTGAFLEGIHDNAQELLDAFDRQDRSNRLEREERTREGNK